MLFEKDIIIFLQSFSTPFLDGVFKVMAYFFDYPLVIALTLIFLLSKRIRECAYFLLMEGLGLGVQLILKAFVSRPRPYITYNAIENILPAANSSFPSGHSITCMMAVVMLWVMLNNSNLSKKYKIIYKCGLVFSLVLCAINRMYLGQHYISDVLAGFVIALIIGIIIIKFCYNRHTPKTQSIKGEV